MASVPSFTHEGVPTRDRVRLIARRNRTSPPSLAAQVTEDAIRVGAGGVVTLGGGSATGRGKAVALSGIESEKQGNSLA